MEPTGACGREYSYSPPPPPDSSLLLDRNVLVFQWSYILPTKYQTLMFSITVYQTLMCSYYSISNLDVFLFKYIKPWCVLISIYQTLMCSYFNISNLDVFLFQYIKPWCVLISIYQTLMCSYFSISNKSRIKRFLNKWFH